jgi:hypothetical protein
MTTLEQELFEKIRRLDENKQRRILEFVNHLETVIIPSKPPYTAQQLMLLPYEERQKAVAAAFAAAADEDFEIFDTFGDEDLVDD